MLVNDLEVIKNGKAYRVSNNEFTDKDIKVISFNVAGIDHNYSFEEVDRLHGRFLNTYTNKKRSAKLVLWYSVEKLSHAVHLKNNIAKLFSGQCYYRELKAINPEIKFQTFGQKAQSFDLDYVSGKQIKLALVNEFDFDTSQLSGEIELEFETINLPYYESIGRSLDLEVDNKLGIWSSDMEVNWNVNDKKRKYTFTNVFKDEVYYHGDVDISQFNFDYNVTITIGETTKEFIWYLEDSELMIIEDLELKPGDVIKYDGIQTFKNGIPINETRMTNPTFKEGWNTFKFNQDVRKVVFDMKFYYK